MTTRSGGDATTSLDSALDDAIETEIAARGPKLNYRTGDELPIRQSRQAVMRNPVQELAPEPDPGIQRLALHTLTLQGEGDLLSAARALRQIGVRAWVTEATPLGPQAVEIGDYLRRRGLA